MLLSSRSWKACKGGGIKGLEERLQSIIPSCIQGMKLKRLSRISQRGCRSARVEGIYDISQNVGLTEAEEEEISFTGLIILQVQVLQQHHDGGIDVLGVLNQPLTVQVVAVVGH